jgi:hypothetical protein
VIGREGRVADRNLVPGIVLLGILTILCVAQIIFSLREMPSV